MLAEWRVWLTAAWFGLTYLGLAVGEVPYLRIDRAGIALVGATLVVVTGLLPFDEAVRAVDFHTLVLLFGMMVVVAFLRLGGFFERLAGSALGRVRSPVAMLAATVALSGVLSAFLVNDVVCLALAPLVLHLARRLRISPTPHLLGLATAANIGSAATLTGNPQNMIVGSLSHITYARFAAVMALPAALGLVLAFALTALLCRRELRAGPKAEPSPGPDHRRGQARDNLLVKSLLVTAAAVALFFAGLPVTLVALGAAGLLLLLGRVRPEKVYRQVDWSLLVMFAGLFVVVHAFEVSVASRWALADLDGLRDHPVGVLGVVAAGLSSVVSNVPAVLLFKPVVPLLPAAEQETAWLTLALASTFAGNLTVLGSVANLIVAEAARREGVVISFWRYCRVGIPLTLLTLLLGLAWLSFVPR